MEGRRASYWHRLLRWGYFFAIHHRLNACERNGISRECCTCRAVPGDGDGCRQAGRAVVVPGRERIARREKAKSHRRERKEELRMADIRVCRGFSLSDRLTMPQRDHRTCRYRDVHGSCRPSLLILEEIAFPDPLDNCEKSLLWGFIGNSALCHRVSQGQHKQTPSLSFAPGWAARAHQLLLPQTSLQERSDPFCKGLWEAVRGKLFPFPLIQRHHCMTPPNPDPPVENILE